MKAVYAIAKGHVFGLLKENKEWGSLDLDGKDVRNLIPTYHEIEVGLYDVYEKPHTLKLSNYYHELSHFAGTVEHWLATKEGEIIPTLKPGLPVLNFAGTYNINMAGRVITAMCPRNQHPSQDFAMEDAVDVVVETSLEDEEDVLKYALFNVCGAWVCSGYDGQRIRLYGAGDVIKQTTNVNINALSFKEVGDIKTTMLKDLKISFLRDDVPHYNNSLLIGTDEDLTGKTVFLVIAGVLVEVDTEDVYGETGITIPLGKLRIPELLLETSSYYDWSKYDILDTAGNILVSKLRSKDVLEALLKHESSFLLTVVGEARRFVQEPSIGRMKVGHYRYPLKNHHGKYNRLGFLRDNRRLATAYMPISAGNYWDIYFREPDGVNRAMYKEGWEKARMVTKEPELIDPYEALTYAMYNIYGRVPPYTE